MNIPRHLWTFAAVLLVPGSPVAPLASASGSGPLQATQSASGAAAARQLGTVKAIEGTRLTLSSDAGQQAVIEAPAGVRVLQLAPGSTDLKTAQPAAFSDVAVGDRVLATGTPGDGALTATRLILMKSGAIEQKRAQEQMDWQRHGSGGLVSAVDASAGTITISSASRKTVVGTSASTIFRRYSGDSVRFEDAKPGTLAEIHAGDQLRVRGERSTDGGSIQAQEIVTGSFQNLSGTIASIDAAEGKLTLRDLTTKKLVTVEVTANSAVRILSPQAAAMFAARARGGESLGRSGPAPGGPGAVPASGTGTGASAESRAAGAAGGSPAGEGRAPGGGGPGSGGGMGRPGGMDLSQMVARLPSQPVSSLKTGDAVMIVASRSGASADTFSAITLLGGVEPILAAAPSGAAPAMTLSPWSVGGGAPEGGGQ